MNNRIAAAIAALTLAASLASGSPAYGDLPLVFEANEGQAASPIDYVARGMGYRLSLSAGDAYLSLSNGDDTVAVSLQLVDAAVAPATSSAEPLATRVNYLIGNNPGAWKTNVETFGKVLYESVYPGVDLVYYGNDGQLEYDFVVAPDADPGQIRFRFDGAEAVRLTAAGGLRITAGGSSLELKPPTIYQESAAQRQLVAGNYTLSDNDDIRFSLGDYDRTLPLVIDPILIYSTFIGGTGFIDRARGIAVDSTGHAYITGYTESVDYPTVNPFQGTLAGPTEDIIVSKLNPEGSGLIYSTYVGGAESFRERGANIAVDAAGHAYVTCSTSAPDFPTTPGAFQTAKAAGDDGCIVKLSPDGASLVYSTYLGANGNDTCDGIALDASGNVYVSGFTGSTTLPTTVGAFQSIRNGSSDAYLAKLDPTGSALIYLTYLGGTGGEGAAAVHVDGAGDLIVAGTTSSPDFPVLSPNPAGPFQSIHDGMFNEAFVAKLNSDGSDLIFSTFVGGSGNDVSLGLAVDAAGNPFVTGFTNSGDFPTASPSMSGPFDSTYGGAEDGFVIKLSADGSELIYGTYIGDTARDIPAGIAIDLAGHAYIAGDTASSTFPTANATQPVYGGGSRDAFVAQLSPDGASLLFSTFLGGNDFDTAEGIAVDAARNLFITGHGRSGDFPQLSPDPGGPFQMGPAGGTLNTFITKIQTVSDAEPPLVTSLSANPNPVEVNGSAVLLSATADDTATGGSPIATVEYSIDATAAVGMTPADGTFDTPTEDATALLGPFSETGVREICVKATDGAGNIADDDCILLPVYDPNGAFVTGGGSVDSPASADLDNGISGIARFGFVSKYLPGQNTPDGNLQFRFKDGDINFKSTSMDWLVVTGEPRAKFRGDGELNGSTTCKFEVDAWDASYNGGNQDAFGLKIFACGPGVDRYTLDATPLTGGNIKIHD